MKTRPDIRDEVSAILRQRGFDVMWTGGHYCRYTIRRGQQWFLHRTHETCNWIKK